MRIQTEVKVTKEFLLDVEKSHEMVVRDISHKIIKQLSVEQLEKLFSITKVDPDSEESKKLLNETELGSDRWWERARVYYLKESKSILYKAYIKE